MKNIFFLFLLLFVSVPAHAQTPVSLCQNATTNGVTTCQPISVSNPLQITGGGGGGSVSITAGSTNIVVNPSPLTGTGTIDLGTSLALGTPASVVLTNATGTASGLTAGTVTTNANLTGPITSVGNATSIAAQTGTGSTFVMQAGTPSITTSLTVPTLIGNGTVLNLDATSGTVEVAIGTQGVGIGTSTTTNPLTVSTIAGGASAASTLTLESTSGSGSGDSIIFATGSQTTRMTIGTQKITTTLAAGIGTSTLGTNAELAVNGGASFGTYGASGTNPASNGIIVSGNTAIGTSQTLSNLTVQASSAGLGIEINGVPTNAPSLSWANSGTVKASGGLALQAAQFSALAALNDFVFQMGGSSNNLIFADQQGGNILFSAGTSGSDILRMEIFNGGGVGIGTATLRNSAILDVNGGVSLGTSATTQLILASSGGVQVGTSGNNGVGTINVAGGYYTNGTQAVTTAGTGLSASGATINSNAVYQMSFQPGLVTSITNTKTVFSKVSKASTVDNIVASASTFSCVSNPTITMYECGTDTSCATSPVTIGTATVTAAGQAFLGTVSAPAITAADYVAFAISAGTCTSLDIGATAQVHSN